MMLCGAVMRTWTGTLAYDKDGLNGDYQDDFLAQFRGFW